METNLLDLPEECIATVISFTTPYDACRISTVSKLLRSVANSDIAWERFLPPESRLLIDHSSFSNKQLFHRLCESPLLLDNARTSFWMEKRNGKKCWMLSAKKLKIVWIDSNDLWLWISLPDSRFEEVAELRMVCWFEIRGKISTSLLSEDTIYGAYLVFKEVGTGAFGFCDHPLVTSFESTRTELSDDDDDNNDDYVTRVFLHSSRRREDEWLEIKLGDYYVSSDKEEEEELEMSVLETKGGGWKCGIIVQGIEIRPN